MIWNPTASLVASCVTGAADVRASGHARRAVAAPVVPLDRVERRRRGVGIGLFILFGAGTIVAGIQSTAAIGN